MKSTNTLACCCFAVTILCLSTVLEAATREAAQQTELEDDDPSAYRLPVTVEPVSYELKMMPVVDCASKNYTFSGQVDVVIKARKYASEVILNAKDLIVSSVSGFQDTKYINNSWYMLPVDEFVYDDRHERLVIRLKRTMVPRRHYKFTVKFDGVLGNDFKGFHTYFYDSTNSSRFAILTQFKPIYARRAFPCFDEPKFKIPYTISIARRSQHFSLSNMPLQRSEVDQETGWTWDHFETTKPIPSYLVALLVSDFDKKTLDSKNIAMFTRKKYIEDTIYMMEKAPNLLQGVEKFTQIPYMLPKLDLVGIPLLDAYNMENWGLNSYQEFYLTLSNSSDTDDKILGTMTVLHEILHQWFGNMVTNPWWDCSWLNEGICNYLNYHITDAIEPDWNLEEQFIENVHQRALRWDEFDDTRPLTLSVSTPNEIINSLDVLTTDKSAALFRMLNCMVGETNFRTALNKYLDDHAYAEAGSRELWGTFDNVLYDADYIIDDDVMVNNSMYLWTEQAGFPLITITMSNGSIVASQERFSLSVPRESTDTKWFVGLTYTTEKNNRNFDDLKPTVWLKPNEDFKVIPVPANSGWIIFNLQSTGFYRVNYDEKNWKLLLIQLITKHDEIHELNRVQIIDDAHHLSRAGLVPWDYYISLLEYLLMEDHVTPWNTAVNGLSSITDSIRMYPGEHSTFKKYVRGLAKILYRKLTLNQIKNKSTKIGWSKLLTWICKSGLSSCEDSALKHFDSWTNGYEIPSEMKEAAFCVGMKHGNSTAWSKMFEFYKSTRSVTYKQSALRALACIENVQTLFNYLNFVLSDGVKHGSERNFKTLCENVVTTPKGIRVLAAFLSRGSNAISAAKNSHQLVSIAYSALASKVATDEEIAAMDKIRRSFKSADLKTVLDEKYQKMVTNFKWMQRDHKKIIKAIYNKGN